MEFVYKKVVEKRRVTGKIEELLQTKLLGLDVQKIHTRKDQIIYTLQLLYCMI